MNDVRSKSLMRSLGEFFGHIAKAVRSDPSKRIVRKSIEEESRGSTVLRRTTIEEIELRPPHSSPTDRAA